MRRERTIRPPRVGVVQQYLTEDEVRYGIVGKVLEFRTDLFLCQFGLALPPVEITQTGMHAHKIRVRFFCRLILLDGICPIRHLVVSRAHHDMGSRRVWIEFHNAVKDARESLVVPSAKVCFTENVDLVQVRRPRPDWRVPGTGQPPDNDPTQTGRGQPVPGSENRWDSPQPLAEANSRRIGSVGL